MDYRIRYRGRAGQQEVTVEAHNPTEALVKFQHLYGDPSQGSRLRESVTSVCPVFEPSESWG